MTTYGADYLRRLLQAVERFEDAFEEWMGTRWSQITCLHAGLFPTVWTKEDQDEARVRELELRVAETAGTAAQAVSVTGAYIAVAGLGVLDPIANWTMMSSPKAVLTPRDVRSTAATIRGRLAGMIIEAEAGTESDLPGFAPSRLHPLIWAAAADHWTTHQYRVAVREAAEALTVEWKTKLNRNDVDDTAFWQQTLSAGDPRPGRPKLTWIGEPSDKKVKSMRGGLEPLATALNNLAAGLNLTVRNVTTHTRDELSEQEAMERLAAYSYLARLLDRCESRWADEDMGGAPRSL